MKKTPSKILHIDNKKNQKHYKTNQVFKLRQLFVDKRCINYFQNPMKIQKKKRITSGLQTLVRVQGWYTYK